MLTDQPAHETFDDCDCSEVTATFGTELSDDRIPVCRGYTKGAHRALCPRCARAVRKVGCFPSPVATDPKAQNSAPYSPLLVHQGFFFVV